MADPAQVTQTPPQPQQIRIVNDFIGLLLQGEDPTGEIQIAKVRADGTLVTYTLTVGMDEDGNPRVIRVDEGGRIEQVPIVTDPGGNKVPVAGTEEGVLKILVTGQEKIGELLTEIANELRLHTVYWSEAMGNELDPDKDLGDREVLP